VRVLAGSRHFCSQNLMTAALDDVLNIGNDSLDVLFVKPVLRDENV